MGRGPGAVGPATRFVASALAAAKAESGVSLDRLMITTGIHRSTLSGVLSGERAIAVEHLLKLAPALGLDAVGLLNAAGDYAKAVEAGGQVASADA